MSKKTRIQKLEVKKLINALPAALIHQLDTEVGAPGQIFQAEDKLVITQAQLKKRPTLGDLLARCDRQFPEPDLSGWDELDSPLVGVELI
ncbi:hypothetical protein FNL37_0551 [Methylovorus glucosotrophus]|uniref:hypothetical protein n=1 Tax=Methylovorus glucosotrophus TaxID=266009 RepID=UPI001331A82F|nr:hypothetical protein [Methylovorus glucosotrophus]KAF0843134.1 hypothetical protein FNL37_0551 [Methylovorus glucosotrophus]